MKNKKPKFWKSLNQYNSKPQSAEASQNEFIAGVTNNFDINKLPDKSRRNFLAVVGATTALTATSCSDYFDKGEIITYNEQPVGTMYGEANFYASTLNDGTGVLVKTREGRPIKIDGNPEHPIGGGKISAIAQSNLLDLYDPSRLRFPIKQSGAKIAFYSDKLQGADWQTLDNEIVSKLKEASSQGKEIAIITHTLISPTQYKLLSDFAQKYPTTKIYSYELHSNQERVDAWKESYGTSILPATKLDEADIILSFENDFLATEGNLVEQTAQYSSRRDFNHPDGFNKLYQIEGGYSLTGAMADYRMRLTPEQHYNFIMCLAAEMYSKGKSKLSNDLSFLSGYNLNSFVEQNNLNKKIVDELVNDLGNFGTKTLALAGNMMPKEVHLAVNLLNEILGSVDNVYDFTRLEKIQAELSSVNELKALVNNCNSGNVGVIIHYDTNPVYHLPADLGYESAYAKVGTVITMIESANESCEASHYVLPINHSLESWGDFEIREGIYSLQQPVIAPLFDTRQKEAILLNWMNDDVAQFSQDIYHKYLMSSWENDVYQKANTPNDFRNFWFSCLHDGTFSINASENRPNYDISAVGSNRKNYEKKNYTLILKSSHYIGDGRYANNGWLQEIPSPVTKAVWDNYAMISPATAKELDVQYGADKLNKVADLITVTIADKKLTIPIFVQPGMADKTVVIELGYGRSVVGAVGFESGFNANIFLNSNSDFSPWIHTGVDVSKAMGTYDIVTTQEHHSLDEDFVKDFHLKRNIINEYTVPFYKEFQTKYEEAKVKLKSEYGDDDVAYKKALNTERMHLLGHHEYKERSIMPNKVYSGVKWSMAIDLNKCTGCGICVAACNVENNIPVVGKVETSKGREMHWMRIDTYFSGTPEDPITSFQPMLCQHCDNAPCENVCPVAATTHSPDGLNQMTYNRCVGTRYCANNCPYKVRRYNFFDFRDTFANGYYLQDTLELVHNPEVTVRARGVMEKCTFCIQRIQEARTDAAKDGRQIKGTDVKTACQEACPSSAISFGDMNDPDSDVSVLREHELGYRVLETLSVKPNVTYISKLRNIVVEENHGEH